MTKQEILENIYKNIAEKRKFYECTYCGAFSEHNNTCTHNNEKHAMKECWFEYKRVMLWDVLDWFCKEYNYSDTDENADRGLGLKYADILQTRKDKTKPIEDQGKECIILVNNLIQWKQ